VTGGFSRRTQLHGVTSVVPNGRVCELLHNCQYLYYIVLDGRITDELEGIQKEVVVA
jgi:hypothetical protein